MLCGSMCIFYASPASVHYDYPFSSSGRLLLSLTLSLAFSLYFSVHWLYALYTMPLNVIFKIIFFLGNAYTHIGT